MIDFTTINHFDVSHFSSLLFVLMFLFYPSVHQIATVNFGHLCKNGTNSYYLMGKWPENSIDFFDGNCLEEIIEDAGILNIKF